MEVGEINGRAVITPVIEMWVVIVIDDEPLTLLVKKLVGLLVELFEGETVTLGEIVTRGVSDELADIEGLDDTEIVAIGAERLDEGDIDCVVVTVSTWEGVYETDTEPVTVDVIVTRNGESDGEFEELIVVEDVAETLIETDCKIVLVIVFEFRIVADPVG